MHTHIRIHARMRAHKHARAHTHVGLLQTENVEDEWTHNYLSKLVLNCLSWFYANFNNCSSGKIRERRVAVRMDFPARLDA